MQFYLSNHGAILCFKDDIDNVLMVYPPFEMCDLCLDYENREHEYTILDTKYLGNALMTRDNLWAKFNRFDPVPKSLPFETYLNKIKQAISKDDEETLLDILVKIECGRSFRQINAKTQYDNLYKGK